MKREIWKWVKDFPKYMISNYGRVKSFQQNKNGRILRLGIRHHTYKSMMLVNGDKKRDVLIHLLVWEHFGDGTVPDFKTTTIDHIDGVTQNNWIGNLQVISLNENIAKGWLRSKNSGLPTGVSKSGKKWKATITHRGDRHYLGVFDSIAEASQAYQDKFQEFRL
ncbi:MAG: hypothetical protein AM326_01765 [Candidatus Thorarchaeota archaeon SMTZ-45]|nr:MAG: hypothetical protein AM326_01765 [Candidatus Thorarchaeota archaeon SMTZ-45]